MTFPKLIVYDFDGVLTDNRVWVDQNGVETVACNRSDGWWIQEIKKKNLEQIILSTETNPVVKARADKLGIQAFFGSKDKKQTLLKILNEKGIDPADVCYIGNDLNDLDCLKIVGLPVCPMDSAPEVIATSRLCLPVVGGAGVVRKLYDHIFLEPVRSPSVESIRDKASPRFDLSDRTALITGGAGLLGIQHGLALVECGSRIVLADIHSEKLEKAFEEFKRHGFEKQASVIRMDITQRDSVGSALHDLKEKIGDIHILVNNAAIDPKVTKEPGSLETSRFENFSLEDWNLQVNVGLTGAFICSQVFGAEMANRGQGGVILNIASDLSVIAPDQRLYRKPGLPEDRQPVKPVTYSVIKTGLIGLTRYLASYWAPQGIRVNALSPGGVFNDHPEEFVSRLSQLIPLGRMAKADEYRAAVQFLCSDASSYMTGQNIVMDGGRSIL